MIYRILIKLKTHNLKFWEFKEFSVHSSFNFTFYHLKYEGLLRRYGDLMQTTWIFGGGLQIWGLNVGLAIL
jgi:hypothetical protein